MRHFVGIDPSSGARSAIGLALVDLQDNKILYTKSITVPQNKDLRPRLKYIMSELIKVFKHIESFELEDYAIGYETTVMQGKGGQTLQRAIGAIIAVTPSNRPLFEISNMQMKLIAGGSGKADKKDIAENLKRIFPKSEILFNLTTGSHWDIVDAIGIGVATHEKFYKKPSSSSSSERIKTVKKAVLDVSNISLEEVMDSLTDSSSIVEEDLGIEFVSLLVQERELAIEILKEAFAVEFIYACMNTDVGKGILLGLTIKLIQMNLGEGNNEEYAEQQEDQ